MTVQRAMTVKSSDATLLIPRQPPAGPWEAPVSPAPVVDEDPPPPEPLEARWLTVVAWAFPLVLMTTLGLLGVNTPGLWEDELATLGMITAPWSEFWGVLANAEASIGPYYVLMRLWTEVFGTSDLSLRIPSVLAMAGSAGLLAALGTRIGGRRVGIAAGTLFAVIPMISRYAQEARPYAITVFAAVLATYLVVRLLERPGFLWYLAYAVTVLVLGLSHLVALLLLAAHALIVWKARPGRRRVLAWLGTATASILPMLPVLYLGQRQTGNQIAWIPPLTFDRVAVMPDSLFGSAVLGGAVIALALVAMTMVGSSLVATAWAVIPTVGLALASFITPLWLSRYLLFVLPAWVLLAALALRRATILRGTMAVLTLGLLTVPAQLDLRGSAGHQQATREVGAVLTQHVQPGDVMVYGPYTNNDLTLSRDTVNRYVPAAIRPTDPRLRQAARTHGVFGALEYGDADVPMFLGRPARIWVVRKGTLTDPTQGMGSGKQVALRASYIVQRTWPLKGFTIALLVRKPDK